MTERWLLHLMTPEQHRRATGRGVVEPGPGGFVHLSTPAQVPIPANLFFVDEAELTLAWFHDVDLAPHVVWEEGDPPSPGVLFPHLYAMLKMSASQHTMTYRRDEAGVFVEPSPPV